MKYASVYLFVILHLFAIPALADSKVELELSIPKLEASPYHKPYVAIWFETLAREPIGTVALWHEKDTWLKDLRQWWRKIGRKSDNFDGYSGATRKPGKYTLKLEPELLNKINAYESVFINIEASREEGDRNYKRTRIDLMRKGNFAIDAFSEICKCFVIVTVGE